MGKQAQVWFLGTCFLITTNQKGESVALEIANGLYKGNGLGRW